jgi:hypothetical protein
MEDPMRTIRNVAAAAALSSALFLASAARAEAPRAVVVAVDSSSDVAEDEVRRAVGAELGARIARAEDEPPPDAGHLTVRSRNGVLRVTFRDAKGRTLEREVTAPADGAARVRMIALLAGNLARNEADDLAHSANDQRSEIIMRVAPGETARAEISPAVPPRAPTQPGVGSTQRTLGWVAVIGGASLTAVGVGLSVSGKSAEDDLQKCKPKCSQSDVDSAKTRMEIGSAFLVGGVVVAAGGVVLLLTAPSAPPRAEPEEAGSTQRTTGLVMLSAGVLGLAAGGYLTAKSISDKNDIKNSCVNGVCPASEADALSSAKTNGTLGAIGLLSGAALAVGGGVLFATAPTAEKKAPVDVGVGPSGVSLSGSF